MKNINDLIEKDGLYYEKDSDTPFNGDVIGSVTGKFNNGKPEGKWIEYYENGQIMTEGTYKSGLLDGLFLYYFDNGQLREKSMLVNGKWDGEFTEYFRGGQLKVEKSYKEENTKVFKDEMMKKFPKFNRSS